jgi:hypothetical protein
MSLINDALKRAHESQGKSSDSPPPLTPIASQSGGGLGWFLPVAIVLLLVAGGLLVWLAVSHKTSTTAVEAVSQPVPVIAAPAPVPPTQQALPAPSAPPAPEVAPQVNTTDTAPAAQTNVLVGLLPERFPKVQGILFSASPVAIVNGRMVNVGDRLGHYVVKQITRNYVLFQKDDGSFKQLGVGQ